METTGQEMLKAAEQAEYDHLVQKVMPKPPYVKHALAAFAVGGAICVIGQLFFNWMQSMGMTIQNANAMTAVIMIFLGALFTGLGLYDKLGTFAGAGSIVPITGFANVIVASAIEFKKEGYIFGVGAKIFSIAGPTLLFGFTAAVVVGLIKFLLIL
ncbi:MAG: stage V sporulation protein AC [Syntrophomonadaceae bacterium]|nr:stage V sporulation protein AC [Syntrophomonadaceae bacterium]